MKHSGQMLKWAVLILVLAAACQQKGDSNGIESGHDGVEPALQMAVEDLNQLLPQRQGYHTTFDSIGLEPGRVFYYYTIDNISKQEFETGQLRDSLYSASVEKIPCSLWRPGYMQGVEVTFTYYSNDGQELIQFSRVQDVCT